MTVTADTMQASRALQGVEDDLGNLAGKAAVFGGVLTAAFGATARSAVMAAGKYEQTMIAFSTMMGSASKATNLLNDLTKFAAETPFEMPEIEQVARGLVMFGESGDRMMETLTMLGNAASGTSSSFQMVGLIFNQIRGVGKLLTQDFRQLSTRGVISLKDIAKYYKVTDAAAQEMISRGKVSFEDFRKIMLGLTGGSGRFANMMEKQSKSMLGLLSTFTDAWQITMRQIGQELVPIAKEVVAFGISFVEVFSKMDAVTRKLVAGTVGLGAIFGGIGTALTGTTFTVLKLHGAYVGMMSTLTSTAAMTETVGAIAGVTSGTVQLTAAARNATIGLKAMAAAAWLTKAGLWGMGIAASALIGYNIGKWLYNMSEEAKNTKRVMDDLKASIDGIPAVDYDKKLRGKDKKESKAYLEGAVKQIEDQIQRTKAHTRELEAENGFWRDNSEVIAAEATIVEKLEDNLSKARDKLIEFTEAGPDLDKQLKDVEDRLATANREIFTTDRRLNAERAALARLEGASNITQNEAAERARLRESIKLHEERLEVMKEEKKVAASLAGSLKEKKDELEVDMKATEKIKEKTKALEREAATIGMTADEAAYYNMVEDKVEPAIIMENMARRDKLNLLQEEQKRLEKLRQEKEYLLSAPNEDPFTAPYKSDYEDIKEPEEDNTWFEDLMRDLEWAADLGMTPLQQLQEEIKKLDDLMAKKLIGPEQYQKKMEDLGKSLTDSVMTPAEQLAEKTALWDEALKKKVITQQTYDRLLKETKKSMDALSGTSGFVELGQKIQDIISRGDSLGLGSGPAGRAAGPAASAFPVAGAVGPAVDPLQSLKDQAKAAAERGMVAAETQRSLDEIRQHAKKVMDQAIMPIGPDLRVDLSEMLDKMMSGFVTPQPAARETATAESFDQIMGRVTERMLNEEAKLGLGIPAIQPKPSIPAESFDQIMGRVTERMLNEEAKLGLSGKDGLNDIVRVLQEANKKTDEVVRAIKDQPKGGLL